MKKERVEYFIDSFIGEEGTEHYFVMAAISEVLPKDWEEINGSDGGPVSYEAVLYDEYDSETQDVLVKGVKLGIAICNPVDEFNEELGMKIAYGRAKKNSSYALYATKLGYINTTMVQAFLEQEAEYFKANPENYIYKRKKCKKGSISC